MSETYIDAETVAMLRQEGLSDALMDLENHTILVTVQHYLDGGNSEPIEYERFTMLDWWAPQTVADCVAKSHAHFVENKNIDSARIAVGSVAKPDIIYAVAWR